MKQKTKIQEWYITQEGLDSIAEKGTLDKSEIQGKGDNNYARSDARMYMSWLGYPNISKDVAILSISRELYTESYKGIAKAIEIAENSEEIKNVVLDINSPGGAVTGLFELCETIKACSKPVYTYVGTQACSAAYAIASTGSKIYATPSSQIGCVGALISYQDFSEYYKKQGIKTTILTAKFSDKKVLDPSTKEGEQAIQKRLDRSEEFLLEHVANTRNLEIDYIKENWGHGEVFFGDKAIDIKMVDTLVKNFDECISLISSTSDKGGEEDIVMDLKELQAKYPELYTQAVEQGKTEVNANLDELKNNAQKEERERINAINDFKKISALAGVSEVLAKCITDGTSINDTKALAFDAIVANYKEPVVVEKPNNDAKAIGKGIETLQALADEGASNTPDVLHTPINTSAEGQTESQKIIAESEALAIEMNKRNEKEAR